MSTAREDARCANTGREVANAQCNQTDSTKNIANAQPRSISYSDEQLNALSKIETWWNSSPEHVFFLKGGACTGKSTVASAVRKLWPGSLHYAAFTGKAASRLRQLGCEGARTIHSLIYHPPTAQKLENGREDLLWERKQDAVSRDCLIVLDECQTISRDLWMDLLQFDAKILSIEDPFQLPPIDSQRFWSDRPADATLTQIHRQVALSPIIRLATSIRNREQPVLTPYNEKLVIAADIVITAFNDTRRRVNNLIRRERGITSTMPVIGERVVALRNDYACNLLNGTIWTVSNIVESDDYLLLELVDDDENETRAAVPKQCFTGDINPHEVPRGHQPMDFGYALTCHKAMGSEWDRVCVLDEAARSWGLLRMADPMPLDEYLARWRYTAVTRAISHVDLVRSS